MQFEAGHIFHIYNQGNNRGKIFFKRENYLFFLKKIKVHLLPYVDVLAYCLMPNHFHLMVYVNRVELDYIRTAICSTDQSMDASAITAIRSTDQSRTTDGDEVLSRSTTRAKDLNDNGILSRTTTFNKSIGIMLTSYTRAINKQENRSGSLFKPHTKAQCLTKAEHVAPSFFDTTYGTMINIPNAEKEYPYVCYNYIHNNPVKAGLVDNAEDWEFSSLGEYLGKKDVKLINRERAEEYGLI